MLNKVKQKGIAMVEFALTVPFLLMLLVGIGEFGKLLYDHSIVNSAVLDGSRYLSMKAKDGIITDNIRAGTINMIVSGKAGGGTERLPGLSTASVAISCAAGSATTGISVCPFTTNFYREMKISLSFEYRFILGGLLSNVFSGSFTSFTINKTLRVPALCC